MLAEPLAAVPNPPDIWGEGALFAFSGLDGETDSRSGFVATFGARPYDLLFHTPRRRVLKLDVGGPGTVRVATGDVLGIETEAGELLVTFGDAWHTVTGVLPPGAHPLLTWEDSAPPAAHDAFQITADEQAGDALVLAHRGVRFTSRFAPAAASVRSGRRRKRDPSSRRPSCRA